MNQINVGSKPIKNKVKKIKEKCVEIAKENTIFDAGFDVILLDENKKPYKIISTDKALGRVQDNSQPTLAQDLATFIYDYDYFEFLDNLEIGEGLDDAVNKIADGLSTPEGVRGALETMESIYAQMESDDEYKPNLLTYLNKYYGYDLICFGHDIEYQSKIVEKSIVENNLTAKDVDIKEILLTLKEMHLFPQITFEIFEKENLVKNSEEVGNYLKEKLITLMNKCEKIKEVRGKGLMLGVELKEKKAPHIKHLLFSYNHLYFKIIL